MELPWLNRLGLLTRLSKKKRMGSTGGIADAAILAGDVLIERFIGSVGDGHIKEQQLIRTSLSPFTFIYSILMFLILSYIYLVSVRRPERNMNGLAPALPFPCVVLSWQTVNRYRKPAAGRWAPVLFLISSSPFSRAVRRRAPAVMSAAAESHYAAH